MQNERAEAVANIEEIIHASDAVMVARGDLGVELGDAECAWRFKNNVYQALHSALPINPLLQPLVNALETMTYNTIPTRARSI